jgi:hypothetical protein
MRGFRRGHSLRVQDRTRSMSATPQDRPTTNSSIARVRSSLQGHKSFSNTPSLRPAPSRHVPSSPPAPSQHVQSSSPPIQYSHRSPLVYPALLSRVAEALYARITLSDIVEDGLTHKNALDGRHAVDKIAYIIKTTDRSLALVLGRALDAQQYSHAVTYDHQLRGSQSDVYQFRTRVGSPFHSGELPPPPVTTPGSQGMAPVRLGTKRRTSLIQGTTMIRLLPSLVLIQTRTRLRT